MEWEDLNLGLAVYMRVAERESDLDCLGFGNAKKNSIIAPLYWIEAPWTYRNKQSKQRARALLFEEAFDR